MSTNTARSRAIDAQNDEIDKSQSRAIAARETEKARPRNALEIMAQRLDVSVGALKDTLLKTVFKDCTDAEFIAMVAISNEYELNPLMREIYAFPKKGGGIQAIVGYDGWITIANRHPAFDGYETEHSLDEKGNIVAAEGIVYRNDRSHPTKKMIYLKEFKRNTGPWNDSPSHMLDLRCFCHSIRLALGVSLGVEGEEVDFANGPVHDISPARLPDNRTLAQQLGDEIPNHDKNTGEIIEGKPESRADDSDPGEGAGGFTEVDEDTARALDAGADLNDGTLSDENPNAEEGPADEQRGETEDQDDVPVWKTKCIEIRNRITAATTLDEAKAVEKNWLNKVRGGVPDGEQVTDNIEKAIAAAKKRIKAEAESDG